MDKITSFAPPSGDALLRFFFSPAPILTILGIWVASHVTKAIYNISPFHPLYRFPGNKVAAATYAYEAYYDWIQGGRYGKRIAAMHEKYGPIIRINPDELHCADPYFVDEIYTSSPSRIRDKWQHQVNTGGSGPVMVTAFSTVPHELHRSRRQPFSRFFSRQQMLKLESEVIDFASMTIDKLLRFSRKGPFDIKEAFNCFTADVISQYAFGHSMGFVSNQEGWEPNLAIWTSSFFKSAYMMRHNWIARSMAQFLPFIADYLGDDVKAVMHQMNVVIPGYVKSAIDDPDNGRVFADLMKDREMDNGEMSMVRLAGEGFNFLLAGTETTAATLTVITYHLLASPKIYDRLMQDLQGMTPESLRWVELEQKPYHWAVIQEAVRMMPGVSHRSARRCRDEDLVYRSQDGKIEMVIPRGTPIGMTSMIQHWNTDLFPEPDKYMPERWLLEDGSPNYKLQKYMLAFGKGHRVCIGENLAYCELYLMSALIALRLIPRTTLYETTIEDLTYDHDMIVAQTKKGSVSVKVQIE
ncbi:Cytochrome P450 [Rhypophila decipiens]